MAAKYHPTLLGYSSNGMERLCDVRQVAEFICKYGRYGDLEITREDGSPFLDTFGIYINRIADMAYRDELLQVLIPMQAAVENGTDVLDEDIVPALEMLL